MEKNKRKMGWEGVRDAVNNLSKEDLFNWLQDNLVFPGEWSLDTADARTLPDKIYIYYHPPMKDKETKEWIREQIEGIEAYDYSATTNGIMEAIERLEQEAERRGFGKGRRYEMISRYAEIDLLSEEMKREFEELKLLEEENGKQNAR